MLAKQSCLLVTFVALSICPALRAQTPSFSPDSQFQGSSLAGWHPVGQAMWRASNGEITGDASAEHGTGWLMLDHSYQDAGLYLQFKCQEDCDTGVLLRAHKTGKGTEGVFVSIKGNELGAYNLTIDAAGKEVDRKKLRLAGGQIRFAPPPPDPASARSGPPRGIPAPRSGPAGVTMPMSRPAQGIKKGDWNDVEVLLDADIVRAFFNDGGGQVSAATEDMNSYGPIALYVGDKSQVQFREIAYRDIGVKVDPAEQVGKGFRMQRLSPFYYGWSADAADFNRDGKLDVVSGPFIYFGPDYTRSREIYPAQGYNSSTNYSMDDWVEHADDFTGDGWPDVLTTSHAGGGKDGAVLYVNPKGESRRWEKFTVVSPIDSEETVLADVDGDGRPELVYVGEGYMRYAKPDPANPSGKWVVHTVSESGPWPAHGIGTGDVNGDGKVDILGAYGWWEQPVRDAGNALWKYHPEAFGQWGRTSAGGSQIVVYDVNGDGLNDVVTTMQAHGWGLAWFEQKRSKSGEISFVKHVIMNRTAAESAGGVVFTEPHGSTSGDVDGDGIPDFIVGKRYWSHLDDYYDPDPYGPAVLYWYRTVRDSKAPGGARFVPELIHNRSGVGSDVLAKDLNGDGAIDIVTSTRSGTYIFWGTPKVKRPKK
ncbi:FG-GAP-like repeat-containing protein [Granulicella sp. dw_53]|uniref:FG-GAP-like repeat-containing protein n=1 Tax=Granulicella sp. dw_53 TaxID=2719792 RepID=UPI001BD57383|nr:FG-GAP-like repeat-containing protein [Granulicella sp. dw_53]